MSAPALPLIGRKQYITWDTLTRHLRIIKNPRILGAVWTSAKVAQRRPVLMCESCWRRYMNWWKKPGYRPDWGFLYRSDCDGCGTPFVQCYLFHAEEKFYGVLTKSHGIAPRP